MAGNREIENNSKWLLSKVNALLFFVIFSVFRVAVQGNENSDFHAVAKPARKFGHAMQI